MTRSCLYRLQHAAWLALVLAGAVAHAAPQDGADALQGDSEPRPVTMQGPYAGFVATPQVSDEGSNDAFVIAPDQRWFAAASNGGTGIRIMAPQTGLTLRVLRTGGRKIAGLSISADSRMVRAVDEEGKLLAWIAATGEKAGSDKPDEIARIDRLTIFSSDADNRGPDGQKAGSGTGKMIGEFLASHGLSEQFSDVQKIVKVVTSVDGRYAVIIDDKSDQLIQDGNNAYRGITIRDLRGASVPLLLKVPDDWCGIDVSSFAFDGRYVVFGNHGGEGDHAYTDSAAFDVQNGVAKSLWHAECTVDHDAPEQISQDSRFYSVGAAPNGPITVWDLRKARRTAYFENVFVAPIISADGSTFAVIDAGSSGSTMLVLRHGKRRRLDARVDADPTGPVDSGVYALSPNGRYFAATIAGARPGAKKSVGVWDTDSAQRIGTIEPGGDTAGSWKIAGLSDTGSVLLLRDRSVFKAGAWTEVSKAENSLIVPLTPAFRPICGAIFCDRVINDLGVVERVPAAGVELHRGPQSPDGRWIARDDGSFSFDIIDVETGRVRLHGQTFPQISADSRGFITKNGVFPSSFTLRDIATGKRIWSLQGTPDLGFVMMFSDGRVRVSPGAEKYVKLVRGFEVRPFDEAAKPTFLRP
jgi:hypothetical protein